jgi:hypothetical protein
MRSVSELLRKSTLQSSPRHTIEFAVDFLVKPATFEDTILSTIGRLALKAMLMQYSKKRVQRYCASISRIMTDPAVEMVGLAAMK